MSSTTSRRLTLRVAVRGSSSSQKWSDLDALVERQRRGHVAEVLLDRGAHLVARERDVVVVVGHDQRTRPSRRAVGQADDASSLM